VSRVNSKLIWFSTYCLYLFILAEIAGRYFITNPWVIETTSELSSLRWQLRWEQKNTEEQATEYPIDEFDPLLGWSPKKGLRDQKVASTFVNFSSFGYRGKQEYSLERPVEKNRVVVVGDSFTFGEEVNDAETYSAYLAELLLNTEVMNFGVHGYGLDQMLLHLQQNAIKQQPNIVVFAFINDDFNRLLLDFRDFAKPKLAIQDGKISTTNTPLETPEQFKKKTLLRSNTLTAGLLLKDRLHYQKYNPASDIEALAPTVFQTALDTTTKANAQLVLLFLPTGGEMIDSRPEPISFEPLMFDFCEKTGITCITARKYFMAAVKHGVVFETDRHYDPVTHRILAEGLAKDLQHLLLQKNVSQ
jgi:hypothetical protein